MAHQLVAERKEAFTAAHAHAENIRKKYDGKKDEDMTPDELKEWQAAIDDADQKGVLLDIAIKEDRLEKLLSTPVNELPVLDKSTGKEREATEEQKTQMKIFNQFLVDGPKSMSPDLTREYLKGFTPETKTATLGNPINAGYLAAPEMFVTQLIKDIDNQTFMRGLGTNYFLDDATSLGAPTLDADVDDADWIGENEQIQYTDLNIGKRELHPHFLGKGCRISRPLMVKARMDPQQLLSSRLSYKFSITEEKAMLTGNGDKKPLGIFTPSDLGISTSRDYTGETSLVVTADDIIGMFFSLKSGYSQNGTWLMSRDFLSDLRRIKDDDGNYVWQPFDMPGRQLTGPNPGSILGRPYHVSEYVQMKTANAWVAGNYPCIFGQFSYYWIATSMMMEVQVLLEKFAETNEIAYISRMWVDAMPVLEEAFVRFKVKA